MSLVSPQVLFCLVLLSALLSAAMTLVAIDYAGRHDLLDAPGARRSHAVATPRGGGIGIVAAVLLFGFAPMLGMDPTGMGGAMLALVAVALIGWIDDHRSLGAPIRIATHLFAGAMVAATTFGLASAGSLLPAAGVALAISWSINLHNFMDGIDGLLASQVLFVFGALGIAGAMASGQEIILLSASVVAATAAFLPFNFPRARIFLGDVGSGALGLLVAVGAGLAVAADALSLQTVVVLCSAFLVDATCTLASRILRGRRWYRAHREHLYQWLVRTGHSHPRVVAMYLGWNLFLALPAAMLVETLARRGAADGDLHSLYSRMVAGIVLAIGSAIWWLGKSSCVARARQGYRA